MRGTWLSLTSVRVVKRGCGRHLSPRGMALIHSQAALPLLPQGSSLVFLILSPPFLVSPWLSHAQKPSSLGLRVLL